MARASDDPRQPTTVRLSPDLIERLDAEAEASDRSRNQVITAACKAYVREDDER